MFLIANMLGGQDSLNLLKVSGIYQKTASKIDLDLSTVPIKLTKINRMKDELSLFKSLSLSVIINKNVKLDMSLVPKITGLILSTYLEDKHLIKIFKDCPLISLEIGVDLNLGIGDVLLYPNLEKLTISSEKHDNTNLPNNLIVPSKLKYLNIHDMNRKEMSLLSTSMPNLETLIMRKHYEDGEISIDNLGKCKNLKVLELYEYNSQDNFNFLTKLKKLERFVYYLDSPSSVIPENINLTFRTPNIKYVEIKYMNNIKYDFTGCRKLENLYLTCNDSNGDEFLLDDCESLTELKLDDFSIRNFNFLSSCISLKKLYCYGALSANGLENCTNLEVLNFTGCEADNFTPLARLTKLRKLKINSYYLEDIEPLANLVNLESLKILNSRITNLEPVSNFTKLVRLNININGVKKLKPLSLLKELKNVKLSNGLFRNINVAINWINLEYLDLSGNKYLNSVKGLAKCTKLKVLDLESTAVTTLEGLTKCKMLESLRCKECDNLTDINAISSLKELRKLTITDSKVRDFTPIFKLEKLTVVELEGNKFMKNLPKIFCLRFDVGNKGIEEDIDNMDDYGEGF